MATRLWESPIDAGKTHLEWKKPEGKNFMNAYWMAATKGNTGIQKEMIGKTKVVQKKRNLKI